MSEECKQAPECIRVSDHALLRYIERVMDIDVEKLRNEIIDARVAAAICTLGNGRYPIRPGHKAVVMNNVVVTVV